MKSLILTLLLCAPARAATTYVAGDENVKTIVGVKLSTGTGPADSGTQRVALAAGSAVAVSISSLSVSGSTINVTGLSGGPVIVGQSGSFTVTPGTGTWGTSILAGSTVTVQAFQIPPRISSVTCTGTSTQIFAANANRRALECRTLWSNSDFLYVRSDGIAATTADSPMGIDDYWMSPGGVVISTTAINCVSNSGSQVIRCAQY